jgi:hypothetical protein
MKIPDNIPRTFNKIRQCSDCSLKSKEVYYSNRFKKSLCLDCLTSNLLAQIRQGKDID